MYIYFTLATCLTMCHFKFNIITKNVYTLFVYINPYYLIVLIDQDALIEALREKRIRGAGLDVMTPEPLPLDHPLMTMENVGKIQ